MESNKTDGMLGDSFPIAWTFNARIANSAVPSYLRETAIASMAKAQVSFSEQLKVIESQYLESLGEWILDAEGGEVVVR